MEQRPFDKEQLGIDLNPIFGVSNSSVEFSDIMDCF